MTDVAIGDSAHDRGITIGRVISQALLLLFGSLGRGLLVWLVAVVFFTGTDLVDIVYGGVAPGHPLAALGIASTIVRIASVIVVPAAWLRVMLPSESRTWAPDGAFWRFALATLAIGGGSSVAAGVAAHYTLALLAPYLTSDALRHDAALVLLIIYAVFATLILMKFLLWPPALVTGDRTVTLRVAWRRMNGIVWPAFLALMALTVPFAAVHFALTGWAQTPGLDPNVQFWIVLIDGPVSVLQVLSGLAVTAAVYKLAIERAGTA